MGSNQSIERLLIDPESISGDDSDNHEATVLRKLLDTGTHFLRFPEPYESEFQEFYATHYLAYRRKALLVGGCVALVMGLMDYFFMQSVWWEIVAIRWGGGGTLLGAAVVFSWSKHFVRHQQTTIIAVLTIVSLVLTAMMAIAPNEAIAFYFPGTVLIVIFCSALVRLDFWNAFICVLVMLLVFDTLILWVRPQEPTVVLAYNLFYIGAGVMGLMVNYDSEHGKRTDFLKGRLLALTQADLEEANHRLRELASLDGLTGVANRLYFDEALGREWSRAQRGCYKLSVLMIDIDYFKSFNDTYGHQAGDGCLIHVGRVLQDCCRRPGDIVARYGGEEFVVILPDTPSVDAERIGHQICRKIGELQIDHESSEVAPMVTASLGVATVIPSEKTTVSTLIEQADRALYAAKDTGRNRVVVAG